jgi:hypothetical protein
MRHERISSSSAGMQTGVGQRSPQTRLLLDDSSLVEDGFISRGGAGRGAGPVRRADAVISGRRD